MSRPQGARDAMLNLLLAMQTTDYEATESYWLPDPDWTLILEIPGYGPDTEAAVSATISAVAGQIALGDGVTVDHIKPVAPGTYTAERKAEEAYRL